MSARLSKKGFTLVELLVVISIIAILSVIGMVVFSSVQKSARDARRRSDIDAIAQALEINKTSAGYQPIANTAFAGGVIPFDPVSGGQQLAKDGCGIVIPGDPWSNKCWYCRKSEPTSNSYCGPNDDWLSNVEGSIISPSNPNWAICANLETGNPAYFCRKSSQ